MTIWKCARLNLLDLYSDANEWSEGCICNLITRCAAAARPAGDGDVELYPRAPLTPVPACRFCQHSVTPSAGVTNPL